MHSTTVTTTFTNRPMIKLLDRLQPTAMACTQVICCFPFDCAAGVHLTEKPRRRSLDACCSFVRAMNINGPLDLTIQSVACWLDWYFHLDFPRELHYRSSDCW